MTGRYRRVPDWVYYFGVLPVLALLPRKWSAPLLRSQARHIHNIQEFHRKHVEINVREFLGGILTPEEQALLVRRSFENWVWEDFETFRFPFWNPSNLDRCFRFSGLEHLDNSRAAGRGTLLITAHLGSTVAGVIALALKGYPVRLLLHNLPADSRASASLREYARLKIHWMNSKSRQQPVMINLAGGSAGTGLEMLNACGVLRRNGFLTMAIDVPPHLVENRERVTFFGRQCLFPSGFLQLAYLTGASVIPYFPRREGDAWTGQSISVGPPITLTGDAQKDLQSCVERLEARVRAYPEQWLTWDSASHFLAPDTR